MKTSTKLIVVGAALAVAVTALTLTVLVFGVNATFHQQDGATDVPAMMNYQGHLTDASGNNVTGTVKLQFDLFQAQNGGDSLWTETHETVPVDEGYFTVQLGSNNPLSATLFSLPTGVSTLYLQVAILDPGGGSEVLPRQPLASVPYAFQAEQAAKAPWAGLSDVPPGFADNVDDIHYQYVIVVAKDGGHFTSIQAAIDSISDAGPENKYLVWVAPGTYDEHVLLKPGVHLVGAGKGLTVIESDVGNVDIYPPAAATLTLADYADVRALTVVNNGDGYRNVAILVPDGSEHNTLKDISAVTNGPGHINYGLFLHGSNTAVGLEHVNSYASAGAFANVAVEVVESANAWFEGGRFGGYDGDWAIGIFGADEGTELDLSGVTAEAANGGDHSIALDLNQGAYATVKGGAFEARDGFTATIGIGAWDGAVLEAMNVIALGEGGPNSNHGLKTSSSSTAELRGGSFTGRGGIESFGILTSDSSTLEGTSITATGERGSARNDGLRNESGSVSMLSGGFFSGQGGGDSRGIASYGQNSILDINQATVQGQGEFELDVAIGLSNESESMAFITGSELWGDSISVLADGSVTRVHLSRLIGGPVGGSGGPECLGVTYGGSFYPDTCPVP